jgi:hypothetical protein
MGKCFSLSVWLALVLASTLVFGVTALAEDLSDIDEDYMQLMKDKQKSLTSNLAMKDAKASEGDSAELQDMFNDVQNYYAKKGKADAEDWSKQSKDMLGEITKDIGANDFDTAEKTSVMLAKTCKECHKIYKKDDKG